MANAARMPEVSFAGQSLWLLPSRAVWWPERRALLVADVHLGKPGIFRAHGLPVPEAATRADLTRLSQTIQQSGARRLFVLGDFLHGPCDGDEALREALRQWRAQHPDLALHLIRGNHDYRAGDPPTELSFTCTDGPLAVGPLALQHEPPTPPPTPTADQAVTPTLAGHLHPAIRIGGEKAPCFAFGPQLGLLPAFGRFTGTVAIDHLPGWRCFAIGPDAVIEFPRRHRRGA